MKKVVRFIIKFVNKATADSVPAYAAQVALCDAFIFRL